MLANARVLGHVFDPLSVFWCYGCNGVLICVVAEVHNTYGERHAYLLRPDEAGTAVTDKSFYVSPFFDVTGSYELRFTLKPDLVATTVTLRRHDAVAFTRNLRAGLNPRRRPALARAHPAALHAPADLGPDPGARHLALAPSPAHPLPATPHPTGRGLIMTVSASIGWPAAATPRAPLRATIARIIFEHAVQRIPVRVTYPDGRVLGGGSGTSPEFRLLRPNAFFARLGRDAKVGFGEAYMASDWRAGPGTDLADLLTRFAARLATLVPAPLQKLRALTDKRVPTDHENTPDGARSNIAAHYDLSNDLFACFLDPTMTYSAAWFDESEPVQTATRLEEAQLRKIDGISTSPAYAAAPGCWRSAPDRARRHPRSATRSPGHHGHPVPRAAGSHLRAGRRSWRIRPRGRATAGLPRDRRQVQRHRQRRDDRGGRRSLLGCLLRHARPPSGARREGEHPGNHHGSQPGPRHPAKLQLDSEVHLPRRHHPVLAGDR